VPSQVQGSELEVSQQYLMLIYPFRHTVSGVGRAERLQRLGDCWRSWWSRLPCAELEVAKDDTLFFLPYVRELLYPELCFGSALAPPDGSSYHVPQAERLSRLAPGEMTHLPADAVIRLTFSADRLQDLCSLQLEQERKGPEGKVIESFSARFQLDWVDVALFPQNVGFLVLKVRIDEKGLTVGRVRDFERYVRLVHPPNVGWTLASWRGTGAGTSFKFNGRDLVDYLLQGLTGPVANIEPKLSAYLEQLLKADPTQRYTASPLGQTYGQSFNLFSFCLLKSSLASSPATTGEEAKLRARENAAADGPPGRLLFDTPASQALYELATCTDSTLPDYVPHPALVKELWERNVFARWDNWQAMTLQDNVVFLGVRETGFTQHALGHNAESDYFTLYLLALFQKTRLSVMFGELMMRDSHLHKNLRKARHLWNAFLTFQDHYWFSEATRSHQGTEVYRHYQQALDVDTMHRQMSAQVRELQAYYEGKFERRLGRLMNLLTFIGLPTTFVITLFSKFFIPAGLSVQSALFSSVLIYIGFFILWSVWTYYVPE
jgi:hypothetical protein